MNWKPNDVFWDGIWDLVAKYDIAVTNNESKPGLPHIGEFGQDVLRLVPLVEPMASGGTSEDRQQG
ncbi:hypothetical protein [Nocardia sp. NPDC059239]|uniref:hypothetical protein n=1 Tax=unclassified Nocardia TaxID=2637762 RepID=UPI00367E2DBB